MRVLQEKDGMLRGCWGSKCTLGRGHNLRGQGHLVSSAVPLLKSVSHLSLLTGENWKRRIKNNCNAPWNKDILTIKV